jgi:hypothetical protein
MAKKTVIKDEVIMYGATEGKDTCHNCISLDKTVNSVIPKAEIPIDYKHHEVYLDKSAEQVLKDANVSEIPYVQHCKIAEDETKKCDTIIGYNEKDWRNLGKKREEEF